MNARHTAVVLAALGALALFAVTLSAAGGITDAGAPTVDNDSQVAQPVAPSDGSADGAPTRAPSSGLSSVDGSLDATGDATSGSTTDETGDATTDATERGEFGIGSERQGAIDEALEGAEGEVQVVVRLEDADPGALAASSTPRATLQSHATGTQRAVEAFAQSRDGVTIDRQFWVTNAMLVTVDTDEVGLEAFAGIASVTAVHDNFEVQTLDAAATGEAVTGTAARDGAATGAAATGSAAADENETAADATGEDATAADADISGGPSAASHGSATYGLEMVNATDTWTDFGTQGEGVRVAVLDSGADPSHPDVDVDGWAEFAADGSVVSGDSADAYDSGEHGTHVAGTVVGGDASGEHIGVAPAAEHYHGLVLPGGTGTYTQVLAGMEWAIDQDADVLSMSLGAEGYSGEYADPIRNARQAGVLPVAAVGNGGQGSSSSPGNVYGAVAVGSVDDTESVASSSGGDTIDTDVAFGDDAYDDWPDQYVVPDLTAPGVGVKSAVPGGGYQQFGGTSMATPHVAGTAALVMSYDGNLTVDEVEQVLLESATLPTAGHTKDDRYGVGIVDAYNATQTLADRDTRVTGQVVDASDAGVANATITTDHVGQATTNETGHYELNVTSDVHNVTADRLGFEPVTEEIDATGGDALERNLTLSTEVTEVEPIAFQPAYANTSETVTVTYRAANVDSYDVTFDDSVSLANASATALSVDGDGSVTYGDTIDYSGESGPFEIDVAVSSDAGHVGQVGLNHTFVGPNETLEDRSGPTTVHDEVVALPGDVPGFDPTDANDSIHSVASFVAPGTTIELANETFVEGMNAEIQPGIQTAIYLPDPVTVTAADGGDPVVGVYNDTPATEAYGVVAGGSDVEVSNLSFVGSNGVDALLETVGDDTVYADNVLVNATTGVSVSGGQGAVVRNNTIDDAYTGVNLATADDAAVALDVENVQDAVVEDNHVGAGNYGAFGVGVSAANAPTDVDRIRNNTVYVQQLDELGANGIDVYRNLATVDTVSGNDVTLLDSGSTGRGIHLFSLADVTNITDNDVTVDSSGMRGIAINLSSSVETIDGNDVNLTAGAAQGVRIDDSTVTTISNTSVLATSWNNFGIVVQDSPGVTVEHNDVTDADFGVSTDSDDLTVADNEIAGPSVGIDTYGDANAITGNDVSQATFGIRSYEAATGLQVLSNDVGVTTQGLEGYETGIYVNETVGSAVIEGNNVTGGAIGIRDEASTSLRYNAVEGANDTGIRTTSDGTTVADVVVNDTDAGVHVAGADDVRVNDTVVAESNVSVQLESAAGAEVADVELYGTGTSSGQGLVLTDAPNATLTNVTVGAFPIGVSAGTSSNLTVRNANVTGTGYGVFLAGVSDATLEDLTFDAVGHALRFTAGSEANASDVTYEDVDAVAVFDGASEGVVSNATVANASNTDATVQFGDVDPSLVAVENLSLADGTTIAAAGENATVELAESPPGGAPADREAVGAYLATNGVGADPLVDVGVDYAASDVAGRNASSLRLFRHDGSDWVDVPDSGVETGDRVVGNVTASGTVGAFVNEPGAIEGTVTDEDTGAAIEGATVTVVDDGAVANATTDASGNYSVAVPDGALDVTVAADGYASNASSVHVGANEIVSHDVDLAGNATIAGRVTDVESGAGVGGATVTADDGSATYEATTNGTGAYELAVPGAGATYDVGADADGFRHHDTAHADLAVANGSTETADVELTGNASIGGTVTDETTGASIENATVTAESGVLTFEATTDASGEYTVQNVSGLDAEYDVTANHSDYVAAQNATTVGDGADVEGVDVELAPSGNATVTGTVTDERAGVPVENASVHLEREDGNLTAGPTATNDTGDYRFDGVVGDYNYTAVVTADGYETGTAEANVSADAATIDATVAGNASIAGTAVDANAIGAGGVENATVTIEYPDAGSFSVDDATDSDGTFAIEDVPGTGGSYDVTTTADGYEPNATSATVDDGAGGAVGDVALLGNATISGAVVEVRNEVGVENATVTVANGSTSYENATDASGTYAVRVRGGAAYDVGADATGYAANDTAHADLAVANGTTETADVELTGNASIAGTVTDETTGASIENANVTATVGDVSFEATTDANGSYVIADVVGTGESYAVAANHSDYLEDATTATVGDGAAVQAADVELAPDGNATVAGTVTDERAGVDVENASVHLEREDGNLTVGPTVTDATGAYQIEDVVGDWNYTAVVTADGYENGTAEANVSADATTTIDATVAGNGTIAGTAVDANAIDAGGVENATVTVEYPDAGSFSVANASDSDGAFAIDGVPGTGGSYDVTTTADGYEPNATSETVDDGAGGALGDVALVGNATVDGAVTDVLADATVENATVTVANGSLRYENVTDASGTYAVRVRGGATYDVEADATGYVENASAHAGLPVADQATETADVDLTGNAEIAGAVADAVTDAGVENATVVATAAGRSYANDTVANGSYAVAVAGTGASYDLAVTAAGYEEGTASGVTVGDGASVASNVSVAGDASITGDVVDANDTTTELENVSAAAVVGDERYPQTNVTNGTYEIGDVPGTGDAYTVNATARAFEWNATSVTVATDATGVDVLLDRRDRYVGLDDVSVSGPVDEGETFTVEAAVRTLGARNWTSNATYLVDGTAVETTELDPNASANDTVAFTDSIDDAGTYALVVETANETAGTNLTVESTGGGGGIAPPPTPEASIVALDLDRTTVAVGQSVAVDVTLQNAASRDASTALELTVDGEAVASTTADVPRYSSATTTLSTTFDVTGTYDLAVNGQDAGTVEVTGDADGDGDTDADGDGDTDADGDGDSAADGDSDGDDSDDGSPGFGLFAGLVAVLVVTAAVVLRSER